MIPSLNLALDERQRNVPPPHCPDYVGIVETPADQRYASVLFLWSAYGSSRLNMALR